MDDFQVGECGQPLSHGDQELVLSQVDVWEVVGFVVIHAGAGSALQAEQPQGFFFRRIGLDVQEEKRMPTLILL